MSRPATQAAARTGAQVEEALRISAVRAERVTSHLRVLLCTAAALRFLWIHAAAPDAGAFHRGTLVLPTMGGVILFSLWMIHRTRVAERVPARLLVISVLVDAVGCSLALLPNVLWPWSTYGGILRLPETITFVILVVAACFRVLPRLVLLATGSTTAGLMVLVGLDQLLNDALLVANEGLASLYAILMTTTAGLAYVHARRTTALVQHAAQLGCANARAQNQISFLMQGHHDALTLVSAALFSLERLSSEGASTGTVSELEQDLTRLQMSMSDLKRRARVEAAALGELEEVDISGAVRQIRPSCERAVSPMLIDWQLPARPVHAVVAGGREAVHRMVMNLLVNAKEGSGARGATRAIVRVEREGRFATIAVVDDGPGLAQGWPTVSTKREGTGSGCAFVESVVSASGGTLGARSGANGTAIIVGLPCDEPSRIQAGAAEIHRIPWDDRNAC